MNNSIYTLMDALAMASVAMDKKVTPNRWIAGRLMAVYSIYGLSQKMAIGL